MSGAASEAPGVSFSFANNFWGKDDAGVQPLFERMYNAKVTSDELKAFYSARAAIEDEYARKLLGLCRKPLGSAEAGTLRASLDTLRGEVEMMGKAHQNIAGQMKSELEEPLAAHAGGMKERRKIVQSGAEKLLKLKIQQTQAVNKSRDRYEQDCLRIKGYLAQGHMVMGQEERKNKAKLEKTQIHLATSNNEYEIAVKALEETTVRWNREWKAACDKFQDLEEERLDFMKSSLWTFANIASTVCVSDDASCEKVRLSLEDCDVEKDISTFINEKGTGQEIPDPPKYINFCRGDVNDTQSEVSDEDNYSVAQFQRTINPAFRTASPQPSTYESHHEPQSRLGIQMSHQHGTPPNMEIMMAPPKSTAHNGGLPQLDRHGQPPGPPGFRHDQQDQLPTVPHNEYPMDGMTMYCRTAPPSERSAATSGARPSSRDSQSDYSNPTSFSSQEPPSGTQSPTKQGVLLARPDVTNEKELQKKRSGFFQNHSPFRRKSKSDRNERVEGQSVNATPTAGRNAWTPTSGRAGTAEHGSPSKRSQIAQRDSQALVLGLDRQSNSPEAADPRAQYQLNVGNNFFDVASPEGRQKAQTQRAKNGAHEDLDPIAKALAELKGVGKQSSVRMSADRYHGISSPAPSTAASVPASIPNIVPSSISRGTPPPSYDQPMKRLDLPQPAFTSAQMQQTRQKYLDQKQNLFGDASKNQNLAHRPMNGHAQSRPGTRGSREGRDVPRATSPAPSRSVSPRPGGYGDQGSRYRSASPNPHHSPAKGSQNSQSPRKGGSDQGYFAMQTARTDLKQRGGVDMSDRQVQLSPAVDNTFTDSSQRKPRFGAVDRPASYYGGHGQNEYSVQQQRPQMDRRARSRSVNEGQFTNDGRPILHHARALYMYQAAIPEELSFAKGDVLAVLRHQDDGWWEAEVVGKGSRPGLVPSNYLQDC